jgi:hypothetical protein
LGGVWGRIGTARPTSVCPRALSTFGRLNRLKRDILEVERSSLGARGFKGGRGFRAGADSAARSRMFAVERVNRHREVEAGSWWRLRMLVAGCSLDRSSGAMASVAKCGQFGRSTHEKSRDKASRSSRCKRVTMGGIGVEGFSWLPVGCRSVASRWPVGEKSGRGE